MTNVIADISMSLDGFFSGPDPDLENGLGEGGEPLHDWAVRSDDPVDAEVLRVATEAMGGGELVSQCVVEGVIDELRIHLAPIVLGDRRRLFAKNQRRRLVQQAVEVSSSATHLTYRIAEEGNRHD